MYDFPQNQCSARDVAAQQGFTVVAELLEEWERRLQESATESSTAKQNGVMPTDQSQHRETTDQKSPLAEEPSCKPKSGCRLKSILPPVYDDVIPSPRNSPQRAHPSISLKNAVHVHG